MAKGRYAEACPAFENALAMNPGSGTKFNLAECYEKTGRLAKALALYRDVEVVTRLLAQTERTTTARARANALEPRVPSIVIKAPWLAAHASATVTLDGFTMMPNELDKPIKVDFGEHTVVGHVDGVPDTTAKAMVSNDGETRTVMIALPMARLPAPVTTAEQSAPPPARDDAGSTQRVLGVVVGGAGVALAAGGGILVLAAKSSYDTATTTCGTTCPHDETTTANSARASANLGGGLFVVGLLAIAGGAALLLTAPTNAVRLGGGPARATVGLSAEGKF